MRLVYGADAAVAAWVSAHITHMGGASFGPCVAIGVARENGELIGGVVFHEYRPACRSIEASFAATSPKWLTRPLITKILSYPFSQLGCERVTAVTPKRSRDARRFLEHFGFKREGLVRKGFGDDDAVISGLLRREWDDCRFNLARGSVTGGKIERHPPAAA